LPTTIWYPVGRGPFPVVVFAHGLASAPDAYNDLLSGWASAGMIVAAPTFPLSSSNTALTPSDMPNQPADVSYTLSAVLALNTTPGDALNGRIDVRHVAAAGHSSGAVTTLALLNSCCRDDRITAAVVLAGSTVWFGGDYVIPGVPTLVVHGATDGTTPLSQGEAVYRSLPAPKAGVELLHGSHSGPFDDSRDPSFSVVLATTSGFLRWALLADDGGVARLRTAADSPGIAVLKADELGG
jgi:predicted dienelactone hydrolase